ncbi:6-hydroxymethylpterin diphosphokinase MptE-like protein [Luteimonas soli]|uniref:6-hydroxymethylpterin diphosphokinase MptE-like protein n=1 Tax=Luteimonas soli TaxID=1648966 RepID=A0ABV7XFB0_9GAMM
MKSAQGLHNIHKGRRCFILGNGPSLNKVDFSKLRDEVTFGVNSFFLMTRSNGFHPTYFVVEDNLVFKENMEEIDAYSGVTKILPIQYAEQLKCKDDCYVFEMEQSFYNKNSRFFAVPQFNASPEPRFYCGQSVTYINMQLAYYMGFDQVVLLGMDFSYSIPGDHSQSGNHIHSQGDDPNHFHKDYFGKGKTWKDPRLGRVLRSYHRAKFAFESEGRSMVNGTEGGRLELFDRVSFSSLF